MPEMFLMWQMLLFFLIKFNDDAQRTYLARFPHFVSKTTYNTSRISIAFKHTHTFMHSCMLLAVVCELSEEMLFFRMRMQLDYVR
jgi:hypothetical protein